MKTINPLITDRWACPRCHCPTLTFSSSLECPSCSTTYPVEEGIPLFLDPVPIARASRSVDLTIVTLALNERNNVLFLLRELPPLLKKMDVSYEILVVDGGSTDGTPEAAATAGARVIRQSQKGYGRALVEGFAAAHGEYIITMDSDLSHPVPFVEALWNAREEADIVVASRYVPGARFEAPWFRRILSRLLNLLYRRGLSLPIRDVSSGFRLYKDPLLERLTVTGVHFEALEEILVKALMNGQTLHEIPFHYAPRAEGRSKARLISFGWRLLKNLLALWKVRSSIGSADYDHRAHDSVIPLQRYWQRRRHQVITTWARRKGGVVLDAGCGSSRIAQDIPSLVAMDIQANKLRFLRGKAPALLQGSVFHLPFRDQSFEGVICSQVIEHIPAGDGPFQEFARVVKPGGWLLLGTPDYGRPYWPTIEWIYKRVHPMGYADEHITHYSLPQLTEILGRHGFDVLEADYILGAELNLLARRRSGGLPGMA